LRKSSGGPRGIPPLPIAAVANAPSKIRYKQGEEE